MTKPLDTLMEKEMSRKEFVGVLALGMGSVMGFSSIIKLLTGKSFDHHLNLKSGAGNYGYGSSVYGGGKDA